MAASGSTPGTRALVAALLVAAAAFVAGWAAGVRPRLDPAPATTPRDDAPPMAIPSAVGGVAEWLPLLGGFAWLNDAVAFSDEDVWAVGDGIVHYDGDTWQQQSGPNRPIYHAVDGFSADALWVVGEVYRDACDSGGFILRRERGAWRYDDIDTHQPLYDIQMLAPDDGWAVGGIDVPAILHYDGQGWQSVGAPETAGLLALHMVDENTGWAVGRDGAIARFDGRNWLEQASPTTSVLMGVHMLDETFGWAVGYDGQPYRGSYGGGTILVYEDGRWWRDPAPNVAPLGDVRTIARDRAVAVGAFGVLLWFDGSWWREMGRTYPGASRTVRLPDRGDETSIQAAPPSGAPSAWPLVDATGRGKPDGVESAAVPAGGGYDQWGRMSGSGMLHRLADMPDDETLLAVGDGGQVVVLQDRDWTEAHAGRQFTAVDATASDDMWVVGLDGPPLHWDGIGWRAHPTPRRAYWLNDVDMVAPGDVWAVGPAGAAAHWDGAGWTMAPRFTNLDLSAVSFGARDNGWTYGTTYDPEFGTNETFVFHWDGTAWRQALHLCNTALSDVVAGANGGAWFAGHGESVLRTDGRDWWWVPIPGAEPATSSSPRVTRLAAEPGGAIWGVSPFQGLARWDGLAWATVRRDIYDYYHYYRSLAPASAGTGRIWLVDGSSVFGPSGSQRKAAVRLLEPGRPDRLAFEAAPRLTDIVAVPSSEGGQTVFAVGSASTVMRYHTTAPDAALPEPTATAVVSPPPLRPTPTPRSFVPIEQVQRTVLQHVDPDVTGEVTLLRTDLLTEHEVNAVVESIWSDPDVDITGTDYYYDCLCAWRPLWLVEASGKPVCYLWHDTTRPPSSVLMVIDADDGSVEGAVCIRRATFRLHLPVVMGGVIAPPAPSAVPRDLATRPVEDVAGSCPTPTPYVHEPGSGYP